MTTNTAKQPFKFTSSMKMLKLDANAVNNQLRIIGNAIDTIYQRSSSQLSFNEIYGTAYNLVLQKQGDALYERVKESCETHLQQSVVKIVSAEPEEFLSILIREWTAHYTAFESITRVLMYMDRTYCEQKKKLDSLTLTLSMFREIVIYKHEIRERLRNHLLEQIHQERTGNMIDRGLLREALYMLARVSVQCNASVYEEEFERFFLIETEKFYRAETLEFISTHTCSEYLSHITRRFAEESERLSNYLAVETETKLRSILDTQLLVSHVRALIDMENTGILALYRSFQPNEQPSTQQQQQYPSTTTASAASSSIFASGGGGGDLLTTDPIVGDLKRFFQLFARVPSCFDCIKDTLGQEIVRQGQDILTMQDTHRDSLVFVRDVLQLKDRFDNIVARAYKGDKRLDKKIKESFQSFINRDNRTAAHLSTYLDEFFRRGIQGMSETEINTQLDKVIVIFHFLSDKDVFEEYYKSALCKRLLTAKTVSDDNEKTMISKLKAECGYQYTTKMEGMFVDMNTSKTVMDQYRASEFPAQLAPLEIDVQVLTTGFWPLQPTPIYQIPSELAAMMAHFTGFYNQLHSGRKLVWYPNFSHNDIRGHFPLGKKDLSVSTFQWCILSLFNVKDSWSYPEIREMTKIPDMELKRHLLSMCTPKLRILCKSSRIKGIDQDDVISFNPAFEMKLKRIKVPLISMKEIQSLQMAANNNNNNNNHSSAVSSSSTSTNMGNLSTSNGHVSSEFVPQDEFGVNAEGIPVAVEENRRHQVEAAIVRIMKARRSLVHNELIAETTRQLCHLFTPSTQFIKKRIESLIEREFLQRDAEVPQLYNYLA